jgi:hypothetical protein
MSEPTADSLRVALSGIEYPCTRGTILRHAAAQGADDDMLGHLGGLPERDYDGPDSIDRELGSRF